jgi:hypothetical protein
MHDIPAGSFEPATTGKSAARRVGVPALRAGRVTRAGIACAGITTGLSGTATVLARSGIGPLVVVVVVVGVFVLMVSIAFFAWIADWTMRNPQHADVGFGLLDRIPMTRWQRHR